MSLEQPAPRPRWVERTLYGFGATCLLWYVLVSAQAAWYQHEARAELERMLSAARSASPQFAAPPITPARPAEGELIGRLEIPRLRLSVAVTEGDSERVLGAAAGHLPDTPLPWERGNAALAAHRDTFFRPLKDIAVGDLIWFATAQGEFQYRVWSTQVVNPDEVWVLNATDEPNLTLVTCYPFSYIGNAPQRFIVRAARLDRSPSLAVGTPALAAHR